MDRIVSCCGVICNECENFLRECNGCDQIKGKPYWLTYTGEKVCKIYECCVLEKELEHCGKCGKFPCVSILESYNPKKSEEENKIILENQIKMLISMK